MCTLLGWVAQGWPMRGAQEMSSLTILPWRRNGRPVYSQNHSEDVSFLPRATLLALNSPTLDWVSKDQGPSCHCPQYGLSLMGKIIRKLPAWL